MTIENPHQAYGLEAAARTVELPPDAVAALTGAGYLAARRSDDDGSLSFQLPDLKAFVARNADNGANGILAGDVLPPHPDLEPEELVHLLDERAEHMAIRLYKMYTVVFPKAAEWPDAMQTKFVRRTKDRFEGILAVAALGEAFDDDLLEELRHTGAVAARRGVKLPQVLFMLRVSRDLVVQNAIDLAENGERPGGFALALLLTRILPAMDRLGDALTAGYWEAMFPV